MRHMKMTLAILFCMMFLLSGCGAELSNDVQPTEGIHKREGEASSVGTAQAGIPYNQELLSYILLRDGYDIADYGESTGTEYSYAVYKMRREDEEHSETKLYWEVVVLQGNSVVATFRVEDEEHGDAFPIPSELVTEIDVNFDGKHDILICLGHFGTQGAVAYKCFLAADEGFTHCPSFTDIANPSVDRIDQVVRSQWRNSAASHSWGVYSFAESTFIETERLTEAPVRLNESGEEIWGWTDEVFIDGEWQTRAHFTQEDTDAETISRMLYGAESYWGLDQAKWETLFNRGKLSDFSIYGN